ncbi:hypothetical protein [Companilactobacillus ginsenosidimutans]|uniref:DUF4168 domain-containing protein n=1 Tax=Companilactobacillus ginsenosidimutans TaxID=1007676 RepID=A0A0H4QKV9_9LACO|nr:hypothetical protein [Companilactobacillus ginsenosidimutans]AKP67731.1 hypothetical protein ABM34_09460 [Companilactobacillus ginsenosidimutans]
MNKEGNVTKKVTSAVLGILTLALLGTAFTAPLNDSFGSQMSNNDVVTRKNAKLSKPVKKPSKVKDVEVKAPQQAKTESASTSPASVLSKLGSISTSKVKSAAKDEAQAAQLIQTETGMTAAKSEAAAQVVFSNAKYSALRSDLSSGNWIGAYQQYSKLSSDGTIAQLQQSLAN